MGSRGCDVHSLIDNLQVGLGAYIKVFNSLPCLDAGPHRTIVYAIGFHSSLYVGKVGLREGAMSGVLGSVQEYVRAVESYVAQ